MSYGTSESGEFVILTTCRLQNHNQASVALPHASNSSEIYEISRQLWEKDKKVS